MLKENKQANCKQKRHKACGKAACLIVVFMALFLSGCGSQVSQVSLSMPTDTNETLGLSPVFEYQVPKEKPTVLVDRTGYLTNATKIALFLGEQIPDEFRVIEKESGREVYVGQIQNSDNGISSGQFSKLNEPGTYYIKCDDIGCSYYFEIGEELYEQRALESAASLKTFTELKRESADKENALINCWITDDRGSADVTASCETLSYLLMGYEMYPELISKIWMADTIQVKDGAILLPEDNITGEAFFTSIKTEIEWLLSLQDKESGGIYAGFTAKGNLENVENGTDEYLLRDISTEATAYFAGTMAKFSYLYQQYDMQYATTCLKAAARAWKYLDKEVLAADTQKRKQELLGLSMFPAAELYRASNDAGYNSFIVRNQELFSEENTSFSTLMGSFTYLYTRRRVDKNVCTVLIRNLMHKAEDIAAQEKEHPYLICGSSIQEMMNQACIMVIVEYTITNHEYETILENQLHYILGRNEDSILYTDSLNKQDTAKLLTIFSSVSAEKKILGEE